MSETWGVARQQIEQRPTMTDGLKTWGYSQGMPEYPNEEPFVISLLPWIS